VRQVRTSRRVKDDQMRSTSTKSKIAADEPARQPPGAVTQSAIAHAENATRTRVAFFLVGSSVPTKSSQPRRSKSTGEFCEVPRDVQMSDETLWPIRRKRSLGCAHHFRPTFALRCKVPRHALQFVSRHPLQFCVTLCAVAAGRESGKRYAFSKAAEPPSFPPWLEFSMSQRRTNDDLPVVRSNSRMRVVQ
jgi:hypothetical protein